MGASKPTDCTNFRIWHILIILDIFHVSILHPASLTTTLFQLNELSLTCTISLPVSPVAFHIIRVLAMLVTKKYIYIIITVMNDIIL